MEKIFKCRLQTLALYRRCLRGAREIEKVETAAGDYYQRYALENIRAYSLERDEYTVRMLLEKGEHARRWVMKKYDLHDTNMDEEVDYVQGMKPKEERCWEPGDTDTELQDTIKFYQSVDFTEKKYPR